MLEIHDLDQSITMLALKKGLKVSKFYFSLSKGFPHDLTKMLTYADKYVNAEGMVEKQKENE